MRNNLRFLIVSVGLFFLFQNAYSQLPSLTLAPGARQLGMGEAFTGLANDAYAAFFNPAGLAFAPLSDEWSLERKYLPSKFSLLVSQSKSNFFSQEEVWSSQGDTLLFFDGKVWNDYHLQFVFRQDQLSQVVEKYTGVVPNLDSLIKMVSNFNNWDSLSLIKQVKLPYNLLFSGEKIQAVEIDKNQRVWVGTNKGLYRFNGQRWKNLSVAKVFQSFDTLFVTSLSVEKGNVWIGTRQGLYRYRKGRFSRRGALLLPQQHITSIATHAKDEFVYVSYLGGIARYRSPNNKNEKGRWKLFSEQDGIYSAIILDMTLDAKGNLWVLHPNAVSHYNLLGWKRTIFKNYSLSGISIDKNDHVWVATNEGVWRNRYNHKQNKNKWTHYHTGNALSKNRSLAVASSGDNTWFITQAGVEKYSAARSQVGFFFENLLPALQIDNLFHAFLVSTFPIKEWGTIGGFINFLSLGSITSENLNQASPGIEMVAALSYGTKLTETSSIGLNFKFIYVSLGAGSIANGSDGIATSYAFDLAFLLKHVGIKNFHFGINFQNIGPGISFVEQSQEDPLPFTWKLGLAYEVFKTSNHELNLVADLNREAVFENRSQAEVTPIYIGAWRDLIEPFGRNDSRNSSLSSVLNQNIRKSIYNLGAEYIYAQVVALRSGYLLDIVGQRNELDLGVGFFVSNIFKVNGAFLRDLGSGVRTGQFRVDLLFTF